jgi:hypothetical protein
MSGLTHIVTATAVYGIGKGQIKTPWLLLLAFSSHFALDAVPHYEFGLFLNYAVSGFALTLLALWSIVKRDYCFLAAGFLGILPDVNWLLGTSPFLMKVHSFMHFQKL